MYDSKRENINPGVVLMTVVLFFSFGAHAFLDKFGISLEFFGFNFVSVVYQLFVFGFVFYHVFVSRDFFPTKEFYVINFVYLFIGLSVLSSGRPLVTLTATFFSWSLMMLGWLLSRKHIPVILASLDWLFVISLVLVPIFYFFDSNSVIYIDPSARLNILSQDPFVGIFAHKLAAGAFYGFCAVRFYLCKVGRSNKALATVSYALVILSDSATFIIIVPVVLAICHAMRKGILLNKMLIIMFVSAVVALPLIAAILELLGRDMSFTGRTPLWIIAYDLFVQKPILGYGFQAFFSKNIYDIPLEFWDATGGLYVYTFESLYVQMAVESGIVGLLTVVAVVLYNIGSISRGAFFYDNDEMVICGFWLITFLTSFVLIGWFLPLSVGTLIGGVVLGMGKKNLISILP